MDEILHQLQKISSVFTKDVLDLICNYYDEYSTTQIKNGTFKLNKNYKQSHVFSKDDVMDLLAPHQHTPLSTELGHKSKKL